MPSRVALGGGDAAAAPVADGGLAVGVLGASAGARLRRRVRRRPCRRCSSGRRPPRRTDPPAAGRRSCRRPPCPRPGRSSTCRARASTPPRPPPATNEPSSASAASLRFACMRIRTPPGSPRHRDPARDLDAGRRRGGSLGLGVRGPEEERYPSRGQHASGDEGHGGPRLHARRVVVGGLHRRRVVGVLRVLRLEPEDHTREQRRPADADEGQADRLLPVAPGFGRRRRLGRGLRRRRLRGSRVRGRRRRREPAAPSRDPAAPSCRVRARPGASRCCPTASGP